MELTPPRVLDGIGRNSESGVSVSALSGFKGAQRCFVDTETGTGGRGFICLITN